MPQVTSEHQNKIREKILKSTYRLFVREGERMTTQMICDDAHVSKGTLFHYFGSKETLLRIAYTSAHEHASRLSSEGMEFSGSEKEIVQELVRRSLVWALDFPEEVIFSERYNDVMHNCLATSTFHSEITGLFDVPALLEKLLPRIPKPYQEYAMISASTMAFHLLVYVVSYPQMAQDDAFIQYASERIWRIFEP